MHKPRVLQLASDLTPDRLLIGGKAASLITLAKAGAQVPPAFVLTTEAYRQWEAGDQALVKTLIAEGIQELERRSGCTLSEGLVVSVRSGAPVSMPGMMDTVLNAGMGDAQEGHEPFVCEARARFIYQFAEQVLTLSDEEINNLRAEVGDTQDVASVSTLEEKIQIIAVNKNYSWPRSPEDELVAAAVSVFESWNSSRAKLYRRMRNIDDNLGTSVTIQQMVFGNKDQNSGSGVCFSRNPTTGEAVLNGEFIIGGQGEEIVAGKETGGGIELLKENFSTQYAALTALANKLEKESGRVQEIELTIESGKLYILQSRPALLTEKAICRVAVEMVNEGLVNQEKALAYVMQHGYDLDSKINELAVKPGSEALINGLPVGGGVGLGRLALSREQAEQYMTAGDPVVFASIETSPNLLSVMQRSAGLITMRGGSTSHAAVVAREVGIPCVVGVGVEMDESFLNIGVGLTNGDWVTLDGDAGSLYLSDVTCISHTFDKFETELKRWSVDLQKT